MGDPLNAKSALIQRAGFLAQAGCFVETLVLSSLKPKSDTIAAVEAAATAIASLRPQQVGGSFCSTLHEASCMDTDFVQRSFCAPTRISAVRSPND